MAYESPLLRRPGAVAFPEDHPDSGVPWHWGDPFAEQRTASRGVAVVDRSHREVITVSGEERLSWLHLVISQHVSELPDGEGTEALVLDNQGRIDAHLVLSHVGGTVYLDTQAGAVATSALPRGEAKQTLLSYLEAMKFWSKVEIHDATDEWALLTLLGPEVPAMLDRFDIALDTRPYAVSRFSTGIARRMPWPGPSSVDLLVPRAELADWWTKLTDAGARPAGTWAFDALRVESRRPKLGVDTDQRTIPHEVDWIGSAAHVSKGCYRGQETVAKVHNVGKPPRNMVLLHLDGSQEIYPETGDPVVLGERTVGRVGSVAQHHELGPIALALVKRSVSADADLVVGAEDRAVAASVDPDSIPREHTARGREAVKRLRG